MFLFYKFIYLKKDFVLQIFCHFRRRSYRKISQKKLRTWLQHFYKTTCLLVIGRALLLLIYFVGNKIYWLFLLPEKNFMPYFYGWGSIAWTLEPLRGGSLLFTTKLLEIAVTHFTNLGRMKGWVNLGAFQWFWTRTPGLEIKCLNQ